MIFGPAKNGQLSGRMIIFFDKSNFDYTMGAAYCVKNMGAAYCVKNIDINLKDC